MARIKKQVEVASGEAPRNFEQDLGQLEEIVAALEEGGLSLDDALKRFEQGIRLARSCEKALTEAEKKIEILMRNAEGELEARPFEEEEDGEAPQPSTSRTPKAALGGQDEDDEDGKDLLF